MEPVTSTSEDAAELSSPQEEEDEAGFRGFLAGLPFLGGACPVAAAAAPSSPGFLIWPSAMSLGGRGGLALFRRGARRDGCENPAHDHGQEDRVGRVLVVVEAERRRQGAVLSIRGRGPNHVQVSLVRVDPHEAGKELQALRGELLAFLEENAVGHQVRGDSGIVIGERVLGVRLQQQHEGGFGGRGGHNSIRGN